jgi:hypothetical protein
MKNSFYLIALIIIFTHYQSFTQQLDHPKKIYVDEQNRLYIQSESPVYLFLSNTPEAKDAKLMHSEVTKNSANPMKFDGQGKHYIKHQDVGEHVDVRFEIYADGIAPKTSISYETENTFSAKSIIYSAKPLKLTLKAKDELSGVDKIYFNKNNSGYKEYKDEILIADQGSFDVKYYAVDNVGNVEKPQSISFFLDFESPVTSYNIEGDYIQDVFSSNTTISFSAKDENAGLQKIFYAIDNGPEKVYNAPVKLGNLPDGEHIISYYATDNVTNKEKVRSVSFYIDKTPPSITSEIIGDKFTAGGKEYYSGRTMIQLSATDNKAGVKEIYYSLNHKEFKLYESPFPLEAVRGSVVLKYYVVDKLGNKSVVTSHGSKAEVAASSISYILDFTGPLLSYNIDGPIFIDQQNIFISDKSKVVLKAVDEESGINQIVYKIEKESEITYKEPFNLNNEGSFKIEYSAFDNVINKSTAEFSLIVDKSGPEISYQHSILPTGSKEVNGTQVNIFPAHVSVFLYGTDAVVGFDNLFYSLNGTPEKAYSGPIKGFQKGKMYKIKLRAVDKLGNQSVKEFEFFTEGDFLAESIK